MSSDMYEMGIARDMLGTRRAWDTVGMCGMGRARDIYGMGRNHV